MISIAADMLGVGRTTIYNYRDRHPRVQEVLEAERHRFVDAAELALHNAVLRGEPWAVSLALKCLGKDRGYVENPRLALEHSGAITIGHIESWQDVKSECERLGIDPIEARAQARRLIESAELEEEEGDK